MGPLSGQKFPKSSAPLNGVPGGQGGVKTPEVERRPQVVHGGIGRALLRLPWELLASVGISKESSDLKDDCLPRVACPGEQGQGIRRVSTASRAAWAPVLTCSRTVRGLGMAPACGG